MIGLEERSPEATKRLARCAGAVYLSLGVASAFGFYHAPVVQSDLTAIARGLIASDLRFRIGVVTDMVSTALAVPLALLLYQLLKPVHKMQAVWMAVLLLVAIPISFVVALNYVAAQWLLSGAPIVSALASTERQALGMLFVRLHTHGVLAVEIFWGLWLVPFGLLVRRSRFLPRVLGVLLIIAGVAYVAHSLTTLLLDGQRFLLFERLTLLARAAGELPIMLWLLVRGASARGEISQAAKGSFILASFLFLVFGCVSVSLERTAEERQVLLHTVLVTGGDAPIIQSLIFFADGSVRLRSVGDKPRWARLSKADSKKLLALVATPELRAAVNDLPHVFACCDARELAVSFGKSAGQLDAVRNPPSVPLHDLHQMPAPIRKLLAERDALGQRYFGRRYQRAFGPLVSTWHSACPSLVFRRTEA